MNRIIRMIFLIGLALLISGSASWAKRLPPPDVKPFIYKGIKYVVPNNNGRVGYIQAWDHKTETKLWEKKVFDVVIAPNIEEEDQWVFIKDTMMLNDRLVVIDELDNHYSMDIATQKVVQIRKRSDTTRKTVAQRDEPPPAAESYCDKNGCEKVSFTVAGLKTAAGDSQKIDAYLFRPKGEGPYPAVVALHGCSGLLTKSAKLSKRHKDWANRLKDLGYVVLFPDSFNPRGVREICTLKNREGLSSDKERIHDVYAAMKWLQEQSFVKPGRIGLLGWSHGGMTVLSSVDKAAGARNGLKEDFKIAIAFYPGCKALLKNPAWWPLPPTTILTGAADDWTPSAPCVELAGEAKKKGAQVEIVVYPGAHHGFDAPDTLPYTRRNLANSQSGDGTATVGTDAAAREDAIRSVMVLFDKYLKH